jgi:hypothetical protein
MNCSECRDDFAAYQEGLLDPGAESRIKSHLTECPACRAEFDQVQCLVVRLTRAGPGASGILLETQVMDRIIHEQALVIRRLQMRKRIRMLGIGGALTAAVVLFFILGFWMTQPGANVQAAENAKVQAAETLAQGAKAVPKVSTIHIQGKLRTRPGDNFSYIDSKLDFVPIEVWKQFGENTKWRVEKPGRVIVMDGVSTIMLIKPNLACKIPSPTNGAFDSGWLFSLTNVQDLINEELQTALAKGWDMKLAHEESNGVKKLLVTVEAKAGSGTDDYLKNKFINTSDTRRVYCFDAETKRLEAINIYLHQKGEDVLIFEAKNIDYDQPIDPETFSLKLPKDVLWSQEPAKLPDNEKYEKMTPKEAATAFFEACAKENWDEVRKFDNPVTEETKKYLGGLQVISLGEPFQAKPYPGWFVPYEIKFKNGEVHKHNLAIRNDNPAKRYVFDGGL